VNGRAGAGFALDDPALWSGLGVFETLRTANRRVFQLDAHLDRLAGSAAWMRWSWDGAAVRRELLALATDAEGDVKLNVLLTPSQRIVSRTPLDAARVGAPVRCATTPALPLATLPGSVKHTSRAHWVLAVRAAAERVGEPVDEVIFADTDGTWLEANRSNVLAVRGGEVHTSPVDGRILEGVTRAVALGAARRLGIRVHERALAPTGWDELYLCSTLKDLAPVARLDGAPGPGAGPVGAALLRELDRLRAAW